MTPLEYLFKQNAALLDWYKQAEEKGRFVVALNSIVVAGVNALAFAGGGRIGALPPPYAVAVWTLLALTGIVIVLSYAFVLHVMRSRHHTRRTGPPDAPSRRMWFFGDVAGMRPEVYGAIVSHWTPATLEADVMDTMVLQNHILSLNLRTKHDAVDRAMACTLAALVLLFLLGIANALGLGHGSVRAERNQSIAPEHAETLPGGPAQGPTS